MEKVSHNFGSKLSGKGLKKDTQSHHSRYLACTNPSSTEAPLVLSLISPVKNCTLSFSNKAHQNHIQIYKWSEIPNGFVTIANVFQNALNMWSFPFLRPVTTCLVSSVQWISVRLLKKANLSSWLHNAIPLATSTNAFNVLEYLLQDHLYLPYQLPTIGLSARVTQGLLCVITL